MLCVFTGCAQPTANFRAVKCDRHRGVCIVLNCGRSSWQDTEKTRDRNPCRTHRRRAAKGPIDPNKPIRVADGLPKLHKDGYRYFHRDSGRFAEHRAIFEEHLGRKLYPGENIHHINGVRDDNRIENLELWVTQQPSGQRAEDLLEWANEIIRRYQKTDE